MSHNHKVENYNRAFAIGIILNSIFVVVEAIYGVVAGSLALLADAGHNLSDVLSLLIAWGAIFLAKKPVTEKRTYGFRKFTIMASTISAVLLLVALGGIAWEAIGRFANPQAVDSSTLIIVAAIGVVINTITALLFVSGHKHDLNIKGAFLHMTADAAISLGVVIGGLLIMQTNWLIIDPLISIIIVIIILIGTWGLLRDSVNLLVDAVPEGIDTKGIIGYLSNLKSVNEIHDLHIWALSTTETALTVHLVVSDNVSLQQIQKHLHDHFDIEHATIQVERAEDANMGYDPNCH
jgi:cobalt-zinc-cadmium efflux system protein